MLELWRQDVASEPPKELEDLSFDYIEFHFEKQQELLTAFWGEDPAEGGPWPFEHFCMLGHVTALYLVAWAASSRGEMGPAEEYLLAALFYLRMDDHDLLEHSSWPFTSFDILSNLFFLRRGWPFQGKHVKPLVDRIGYRVPMMWPALSPRCWPWCPDEEPKRKPLKVWWISKHPAPWLSNLFKISYIRPLKSGDPGGLCYRPRKLGG